MACPRCGNQNIKVSKVTLLGKEPEVTFGVRNDDVVVHSYYCGKCELLEESASAEEIRRLWLRWESAPQLEQQVTWTETEDPFEPIAAVVDGHVGLPRFRGHLPSLSRHDERGVHETDEVVQAAQAPQVHA